MRADRIAAAVLLIVGVGCSIEPTPREYIDRPRADLQQEETREAIDARLRLLVHSLARGDPASARAALSPAPEVRVYGPGPRDRFEGGAQLDALVGVALSTTRGAIRLREVEIDVDPRGTVAWFAALIEHDRPTTGTVPVRVTGVYRLHEGEWLLTQAHVRMDADSATAAYPSESPAPAGGG